MELIFSTIIAPLPAHVLAATSGFLALFFNLKCMLCISCCLLALFHYRATYTSSSVIELQTQQYIALKFLPKKLVCCCFLIFTSSQFSGHGQKSARFFTNIPQEGASNPVANIVFLGNLLSCANPVPMTLSTAFFHVPIITALQAPLTTFKCFSNPKIQNLSHFS